MSDIVTFVEESARNSASHVDLSAPPPPLLPDTTDRLSDDEVRCWVLFQSWLWFKLKGISKPRSPKTPKPEP